MSCCPLTSHSPASSHAQAQAPTQASPQTQLQLLMLLMLMLMLMSRATYVGLPPFASLRPQRGTKGGREAGYVGPSDPRTLLVCCACSDAEQQQHQRAIMSCREGRKG
ncbi:hypothetical protein K505DRAFT_330976 [Melanomma pulvis-pyrius CBS 109.77]|uniref:Uncharacterized protein n=1 Tax=Melanomma pulvis-pyrius CBS 109.77 TaxID=1314802 RepID=A0A6A6WN45_9PLEO|nr:hypothetical protein K505DRAFT_330976 [Melanomma pulvis-pyrius CBS 109.77]